MKTPKELSAMLADQCESVCHQLLPGGKPAGGMWQCGDLTGGDGKSLQVHLTGPHAGKWRDWAESELRGDLIDLWREVKGISAKQALAEVRDYLGVAQPLAPMKEKVYDKPRTDHKEPSPDGPMIQWFAQERQIEPPIVNRFQIKGHRVGTNGTAQTFIVFPCFNPEGDWINSSYRSLGPGPDGKKKVFQDKGCAPCLFGWHGLDKRAYEKRSVLLCEGQIDCLTWTQWGIDALSIPNGNGTTWIEYEWDNLEVFDTIYLSFDMDGKTKDALQKVVARLGVHRCLIVKLPEKDANDCLKKGHKAEDAARWISQAKAPSIPDFVPMGELRNRLHDVFFPKPTSAKPIKLHLFEASREEDVFLLRPGELSVWTGISSHGKTTFLTYLFVNLAHRGERSFICSLEMKPEKIARKMLLSLCREKDVTTQDIDDFVEALSEVTCFCDRIGYIEQAPLFEMMEYAHRRYGVTQFLIDSMMRIDGLEENYPAQGTFLSRLSQFAQKYMVHVHLVVHPRKTNDDIRPTANDLKGSSLLRNNADNILVVSRNVAKERKLQEGEITEEEAAAEYDTQVLVEKDREEGKMKSFKYKFIWKHHYFIPMAVARPTLNSENGESSTPQPAYAKKSTSSFPRRKSR